MVGDADKIESRIVPRGAKPVASPAVMISPTLAVEAVHVFHERSGETHLHTGVRDVRSLLHRILRPFTVSTGSRIVHPAHAEIEEACVVGLIDRFIRIINRLMHVPQIGHMDRILRSGRRAKEECGGRHAECHKKSQNGGEHEQ
jgi:hypothetical protein